MNERGEEAEGEEFHVMGIEERSMGRAGREERGAREVEVEEASSGADDVEDGRVGGQETGAFLEVSGRGGGAEGPLLSVQRVDLQGMRLFPLIRVARVSLIIVHFSMVVVVVMVVMVVVTMVVLSLIIIIIRLKLASGNDQDIRALTRIFPLELDLGIVSPSNQCDQYPQQVQGGNHEVKDDDGE